MVYFEVEAIEAVLGRVGAAGGKVLNDRMSIGGHGFVGHLEDSEGNRIGLRTSP